MDALAGIELLASHVPMAFLVFTRFACFLVSMPVLSGGQAPLKIKAALSLAFTFVVYPTMPPESLVEPGALYPLMLVKEALVGLLLGFLLNLFIDGVRFAGDMIGRSAGFAASEVFNPDAGSLEGPLGQLFGLSVMLLFFLVNGHLELIAALARSFHMLPVGGWTPGPWLVTSAVESIDRVFVIALTLALPIEGALLAITVAEGVMARAVPQINILMISFAIKILATLLVIIIALPLIVAFMGVVLVTMTEIVYTFITMMNG